MKFEVNILGCGSATPSRLHNPSCQVVDFRDKLFMIDCGEGAQKMMRKMGLKFSRLSNIFISHLHGDHVLGLPGLLSTMDLHGRGGEVTIHTFKEGKEVLAPFLDYFCRETPFTINWNVITPTSGIIYEDSALTVETFPLNHRIPAAGFIFREKESLRTFRKDMREFYDIPVKQIQNIKEGADFITADGKVIPNDRLTLPPKPARSYAYCSDTMASGRIAEAVKYVGTLYHEATYLDEIRNIAHDRRHSTAKEAAETALAAHVGQLVIGHYSKRYSSTEPLLEEAKAVFPNTIAANEGMTIPVEQTQTPNLHDGQ